MMEEIRKECINILEDKDIVILSSTVGSVLTDESDIVQKLKGYRLLKPYGHAFIIRGKKDYASFTVEEYPSCCGKILLHAINVKKTNHINWSITEGQFHQLTSAVFRLVEWIADIADYSSVSLVISSTNNNDLYNLLEKHYQEYNLIRGLLWNNDRYDYTRLCRDYTISYNKKQYESGVEEEVGDKVRTFVNT